MADRSWSPAPEADGTQSAGGPSAALQAPAASVRSVGAFSRTTLRERRALALAVLERGLIELRRCGWCQGAGLQDGRGRLTLLGSIAEGTLAAWCAREALQGVLHVVDLAAWNDSPARERREVVRALERAIRLCRAELAVHRGGWRVSSSNPQHQPKEQP